MLADLVLDASIAGKCLFNEPGSAEARAAVVSAANVVAPDLLFTELASIAAKKVRGGEVSADFAAPALDRAGGLLTTAAATPPLVPRAFELAVTHGFSVYDSLYVSLAELRGFPVLTADRKLAARARAEGLGGLVTLLQY